MSPRRVDERAVGWSLGRAVGSRQRLWVPYDSSTLVVGPMGSGKSLRLVLPTLMNHHGPSLVTLTKLNDLLLAIGPRNDPAPGQVERRPVLVLDPFGDAPGVPQLVPDALAGCADPMVATRRAMAFGSGTIGAGAQRFGDAAARFYAAEAGKVMQGYFLAAALTGRSIEHVMEWVAEPVRGQEAVTILERHQLAPFGWDALVRGAIYGASDTSNNTIATVHQAFNLFFQPSLRARCTPGPGRPATDLAAVIRAGGTIFLLGREDIYTSVSPLMTAVAEDVLQTARELATASEYPRLVPPLLADLDELASTTPVPSLITGIANDRDLGIGYIIVVQIPRQLTTAYGIEVGPAMKELTNNIIIFGGTRDTDFNEDVSRLCGTYFADTDHGEREYRVIPPEQVRMIPDGQALVLAGNAPPLYARPPLCIEGRAGRALLERREANRRRVDAHRQTARTPEQLRTEALRLAAQKRLTPQDGLP